MPGARDRTDGELMRAVREGELDALDLLFARHHRRLFGFLVRLTGDAAGAEDLVQEVFLRLLRFREKYDGHGDFLAWLFRIARNAAIDARRRRKDEVVLEDNDMASEDAVLPLERLTEQERHEQLERALSALPLPHREVLLLRGVEGLSHREVAQALGCTEGAARVRVHRATLALKRVWQTVNGAME